MACSLSSLPLFAASSGLFIPHPTTPSFGSGEGNDVALGDLDTDGDLDVVIANQSGEPETVWLNDGDGNFTFHQSFGGGLSIGIDLGDIDGDGDLDAVVANYTGEAETAWENDGTGTFTLVDSFGAGYSVAVDLDDIDGDGDLDAVVANAFSDAETVWLNDGNGDFSAHPTTPSFGADYSEDIDLGDLDGDGDLDAVVANRASEPETVWLNDGAGNFTAHPTPGFGAENTNAVALGDIDGDGDLDALTANDSNGEVYLNDGSGVFTYHGATTSFTFGVELADLDGDGDLDAAFARWGGEEESWLNDGNGVFTLRHSFGGGNTRNLALGDIDGDGDPDLVATNDSGQANTVWLNALAGTVIVTAAPPLATSENGTSDSFTVVLSQQPSSNVTIAVSSGCGSGNTRRNFACRCTP